MDLGHSLKNSHQDPHQHTQQQQRCPQLQRYSPALPQDIEYGDNSSLLIGSSAPV